MTALRAGATLALWRLKGRWTVVATGIALLAALLIAALERSAATTGAADRALRGAVFGLLLPLATHALWSRCTRGRRLGESLRSVTRHGGRARTVTLGFTLCVVLLATLGGAALAALAVLAARGVGDPALVSDLLTSGWIGALAGAAYAAWFGLGSTVGAKGGGRLLILGADWILGTSSLAMTLALPRGHLYSLLGGVAGATHFSQAGSGLFLLLASITLVMLATWQASR